AACRPRPRSSTPCCSCSPAARRRSPVRRSPWTAARSTRERRRTTLRPGSGSESGSLPDVHVGTCGGQWMSTPGTTPAHRHDDEVTVMHYDHTYRRPGTYRSAGTSASKRLVRSEDRGLGGVAGGVADYFDIDPLLVSVLFIASCLLPGPQVLLYLILWFVMPDGRA